MASPYTWEDLRALTARRQFPEVTGTDSRAVVELFSRVGPIQAQAPRAPFLTVSSRLPGATHADITAAYEAFEIVRGTSLRGTVHTSLLHQHTWLQALCQSTLARLWCRTLGVTTDELTRLRGEIEQFAATRWRTHHELNEHMAAWLADRSLGRPEAVHDGQVGSALMRGHPALVRRPLSGGWHQSGTAGYRTASAVVADPTHRPRGPGSEIVHPTVVPDRTGTDPVVDAAPDPEAALTALTRTHLSSFGPATRADIAWWSGAGLRQVDVALRSIADELTNRPGPGDADYFDLAEDPGTGDPEPGFRLLPEYDSVLLGYAPTARRRFAEDGAVGQFWNRSNGVFSPPVLADGLLRATWRPVKNRHGVVLEVVMLAGERPLDPSDLAAQATAVGLALGVEVTDVQVVVAET